MIIVTGALGFIGSCLVKKLNNEGYHDIMVVDDFYKDHKEINLSEKQIREWYHRNIFMNWFEGKAKFVDFVFHMGARTDTTEPSSTVFEELNLEYSKAIWNICAEKNVPLIYASSAATYGLGEQGFKDDHELVKKLKPLNAYGKSKNDFDSWVLSQKETPPFWAGLKFFNVYGPNEYHKGRMASVIFHTVNQIKATGEMKLFKSHKKNIIDGEQKRDFVYVKDVLDVCWFLFQNQKNSGLYNVGTGQARTFLDLTENTFKALGRKSNISFMDTPKDIRKNYQYFTEADMTKLRAAGYNNTFTSLEDGISDYVGSYLSGKRKYY